MENAPVPLAHVNNPVRRILAAVTASVAVFGGIVVGLLSLLTVVSIVGRWLSGIPLIADTMPAISSVAGDFELIEMGTAIAVSSFLPYTQMRYGHVTVDILVDRAGPRTKAALTMVANALFTVASSVLTWQLALGLEEKIRYQETSMILAVPIWYAYVPTLAFLALLAVACAYTTVEAALDTFSRDPLATRSVAGQQLLGGQQ